MNKEIELIGVDQKVYALGCHEPPPMLGFLDNPLSLPRRTTCALAGFRDDASLKFQPPGLRPPSFIRRGDLVGWSAL